MIHDWSDDKHLNRSSRLPETGGASESEASDSKSVTKKLASLQEPNGSAAHSGTGDAGFAADKARSEGNTAYRGGDWAAAAAAYSR